METKGKEGFVVKISSNSKKQTKAESNAAIKYLAYRIQVKWKSGRNNFGEMNMKDTVQEALQTSVMDVLFPIPLTYGFKLGRNHSSNGIIDTSQESNLNTHVTETDCHSDFLEMVNQRVLY